MDIKEIAQNKGLKAEIISEICGVSVRTAYYWLAGKTEPRYSQLKKIIDHKS